jgi:hypothetical protein
MIKTRYITKKKNEKVKWHDSWSRMERIYHNNEDEVIYIYSCQISFETLGSIDPNLRRQKFQCWKLCE